VEKLLFSASDYFVYLSCVATERLMLNIGACFSHSLTKSVMITCPLYVGGIFPETLICSVHMSSFITLTIGNVTYEDYGTYLIVIPDTGSHFYICKKRSCLE
jgi:hypothetical protein